MLDVDRRQYTFEKVSAVTTIKLGTALRLCEVYMQFTVVFTSAVLTVLGLPFRILQMDVEKVRVLLR